MEDYPHTLAEFEARFSTEEACRAYLMALRWPTGFVCGRCGGNKSWETQRRLLVCSDCGYQTSATAGTIFQDTHKGLMLWFRAIWWMTNQKTGASALGLQRLLGLGSYRTAWSWLHKLRRAMVRPGRDRLSGRVEVDDAYVGGVDARGTPGRHLGTKALIVVAAEEDGHGIGRIRMGRVKNASAKSLHGFVQAAVEPGSGVHTDDWRGYWHLDQKGYDHEITQLQNRPERPTELLPRVHRVVSLLKRWLLGTLHGAVSHDHLDYYLDEFTFRFNRRTSRHRGKLFYRLLQQAVAVGPTPYREMVKHVRGRQPQDHNI